MNKILKSLSVIAFVAAIAVGATSAYFSDEEKVSGNTITAGTIDISLSGNDSQTQPYSIADVKPGETGYINYDIANDGTNPVNVSKNLNGFQGTTGANDILCDGTTAVSSEPECEAALANTNDIDKNDIESQIIYDLKVEVYEKEATTPRWHQTIYVDSDHMTLSQVYPNDGGLGKNEPTFVALGMIPVGGHMKVTQSYHLAYEAGNEYQGDVLTFNTTFKGQQLTGADGYAEVVLENKTGPDAWAIKYDNYRGILKYKTQGPVFDFKFTGVAPLPSHVYKLAVGYDNNTNVNIEVGTGSTDSNGNIIINGTFNTNTLTNAKVWLIPTENWTSSAINWTGWPTSAENFLWETSLIDYTKN